MKLTSHLHLLQNVWSHNLHPPMPLSYRLRLKCDGTRTETRFRLSPKRTSPFKSAGASVQSTAGSRGVRISGSNAGYTMFRGNVKSTRYTLHSTVSPSLPLPCIAVCHHISIGIYTETALHLSLHYNIRALWDSLAVGQENVASTFRINYQK